MTSKKLDINEKNKISRERIPFQSETHDVCSDCNAQPGELHLHGCGKEDCPECGAQVLKCSCMCLSALDGLRIQRSVAATITPVAIERLIKDGSRDAPDSYFMAGVTSRIIKNICDENQRQKKLMLFYGEELGLERIGNKFSISSGDLADILSFSIIKVSVILRDMSIEDLAPEWQQQAEYFPEQ